MLKYPDTVETVKRLLRTIAIVSYQAQVLTQQRVEFRGNRQRGCSLDERLYMGDMTTKANTFLLRAGESDQ